MKYYDRACKVCIKGIDHKRIDAIYCSDKCRMRVNRDDLRQALVDEIIKLARTIPNYTEQISNFVYNVWIYCPDHKKHRFVPLSKLKKLPIHQLKREIRSLKSQNLGESVGLALSLLKKSKK